MVAIREMDGLVASIRPVMSALSERETPSLSQPQGQRSLFPRARDGADGLSTHTNSFRLGVFGEVAL